MMKIAIATERYDLHRLACAAIRACDSKNVSDVDRCCDILRYLMRLNLSVKDLSGLSKAILPLEGLRVHENPKIRTDAHLLFNSWMKTLYSTGANPSSLPLHLKKARVVNENTAERKKKTEFLVSTKDEDERSQSHETGEIDDCKSFAAKLLRTKKHLAKLSEYPKHCPASKRVRDDGCKSIPTKFHRTQKKPDAVQVFSKLKMTDDQRSLETGEMKETLKKSEDCKSIAARSILAKKQSTLPMKPSENPRYRALKQNLKKPNVCKSVPPTSSRPPQMKMKQLPLKVLSEPLKKNSTEMLELFEIAKKSADMANAKGLLTANAETSICVDTLSLLMGYPISSTATETRRIMVRLEHLTKHKDRKICNSASALLHHWRQSIRDQEHKG